MASKAYVVAMTVSELRDELKQRGMSTKGSKKDLRDRLEQALDDEELDDPSSGSEGGGDMYSLGFNFEVPPESFIAEEDLLPDDEEDEECEPMIVSVELSNMDSLKVCPRASASAKMGVGVRGRSMGDRSLNPMVAPMIVEIDMLGQRQGEALNAYNNNDKNSRYIGSSNQINSSPSTTSVTTATSQSKNNAEPAAGGKLLDILARGQGGNVKLSGAKKAEVHLVPQDGVATRTEVSTANYVREKKDSTKIEQVVMQSVHSTAAVADLLGAKKSKRACAAAAVSKIKASMEDTGDGTSRIPAGATVQSQPPLADSKFAPEAVSKNIGDAVDTVRPSRDAEKRKASGVTAAKSRAVQKSAVQEVSKEATPVQVEEPMTVTVGKRESRRRTSEKMEVDPSPTVATAAAATKPKESLPTGRKGKQTKDSTTTESSPKSTPPEQSNLFPDYRSCPPQRAAAVAALRNAALAQRSSSQRSSTSQKSTSPSQKNSSSPTQKTSTQKSANSPKGTASSQKSPASVQKGPVASQKSGAAQKSSSPAQKQATQKSSSPAPLKQASAQKGSPAAKKPLPAQKGSVSVKKPVPGQKGAAQKPEAAQKTSTSPASNPVPDRKSSANQKSGASEKASGKGSAQKSTTLAADSVPAQKTLTLSQSDTTPATKRKRISSPPQTTSKTTPPQVTSVSSQGEVPVKKSPTSVPVDSTSVLDPSKTKKTSSPGEGRAAIRKASQAQKQEQVESVKKAVGLEPVQKSLPSSTKRSEKSQKLNDAVKRLTLTEGVDQKKIISSSEKKTEQAVKNADKSKELVKEEKKVEKSETKQSPSVPISSSRSRKAAVSRRVSISKGSRTPSKEVDVSTSDMSSVPSTGKASKKEDSALPQNETHPEGTEVSETPPSAKTEVDISSVELLKVDAALHDETEVKKEEEIKDVDMEDVSEDQGKEIPNVSSTDPREDKRQVLPSEMVLSGTEESAVAADQVEHEKKPGKILEEKNLLGESSMEISKSKTVGNSKPKGGEAVEDMVTSSTIEVKEPPPQPFQEEHMEVDTLVAQEEASRASAVPTSSETEKKATEDFGTLPVAKDAVVSSSDAIQEDARDAERMALEKEEEPMEVAEEKGAESVALAASITERTGESGKGSGVCETAEGGGKEEEKVCHVHVGAEDEKPGPVDIIGEKLESQQPRGEEIDAELKGKISSRDLVRNQAQHEQGKGLVQAEEVDGQGATTAQDLILKTATRQKQEEPETESDLVKQVESKAQKNFADEGEGKASCLSETQVCSNEALDKDQRDENTMEVGQSERHKDVDKREEIEDNQKVQEKDPVQDVEQKKTVVRSQEPDMAIEDICPKAELLQSSKDEEKLDVEKKNESARVVSEEMKDHAHMAGETVMDMELGPEEGGDNVGKDINVPQVSKATASDSNLKEELDSGTIKNVDNKDVEVNTESDTNMEEKPTVKESGQIVQEREDGIVEKKLPGFNAPEADDNARESTTISAEVQETEIALMSEVTSNMEAIAMNKEDTIHGDQEEKTSKSVELHEFSQSSAALPHPPERPTSIVTTSSDPCHYNLTSSPCSASEPVLIEPERAALYPAYKYSAEHKSSGFLSPRRSPAPSSSLLDEDRGLVASALLNSPAPSLDDTSSMRVEPPSPRSEISNMELPSFSEVTPVDGQASAMELSGFDIDDPMGAVPHMDQVREQEPDYCEPGLDQARTAGVGSSLTGSQLNELAVEEKLGSEVSSELSSLPPPGIDDEVSESGMSMGDAPVIKEGVFMGDAPVTGEGMLMDDNKEGVATIDFPQPKETPASSESGWVANVATPVEAMELEEMETKEEAGQEMKEEAERASLEKTTKQGSLPAEQNNRENLVNLPNETAVTSAEDIPDKNKDIELPIPGSIVDSERGSLDRHPITASASDNEKSEILPPTTGTNNNVSSTFIEDNVAITSEEGPTSAQVAAGDLPQDMQKAEDMDIVSEPYETGRTETEELISGQDRKSEVQIGITGKNNLQKDETREEDKVMATKSPTDEAGVTPDEVSSPVCVAETVSATGMAMMGGLQSLQAAYDDDDESSNASSTELLSDNKEQHGPTEQLATSMVGKSMDLEVDEKVDDVTSTVIPDTEVGVALEKEGQSDLGVASEQEPQEAKNNEVIEEDVDGRQSQDNLGDTLREERSGVESSKDDGPKKHDELEIEEGDQGLIDQGVVDMEIDDKEEEDLAVDAGVPEAVTEDVSEAMTGDVHEAMTGDVPEAVTEDVPEAETEDVSETVIKNVPKAVTEDVPEAETENVPEAMTEDVPETMTEDVPETMTEDVPEAVTEDVPKTMTEAVPETMTEAVPETMTEDVPEAVTGDVPEAVTGDVPEAVTEDLPEAVTEDVPEAVTEDVPEAVTEDVPEAVTEDVPEAVTEDVPEAVTEDLPEAVTEDLPEVATDDVPETVPGDVSNTVKNENGLLISSTSLLTQGEGALVGVTSDWEKSKVTKDEAGRNQSQDISGSSIVGEGGVAELSDNDGLKKHEQSEIEEEDQGMANQEVVDMDIIDDEEAGFVPQDVTRDVPEAMTRDVTGDTPKDVTGDILKDVTGDILKDVTGDVTEVMTGDVMGDVPKELTGDMPEDVSRDVTKDVTGDIREDVTGDVSEAMIGDVSEDVTGGVPKAETGEDGSLISSTCLSSQGEGAEVHKTLDHQSDKPIVSDTVASVSDPPISNVSEQEDSITSLLPQGAEEKSWDGGKADHDSELLESEACDEDNTTQDNMTIQVSESQATSLDNGEPRKSQDGSEGLSSHSVEAGPAVQEQDQHYDIDGGVAVERMESQGRDSVSSDSRRRQSVKEDEDVSCFNVDDVITTDTHEEGVSDEVLMDQIPVIDTVEERSADPTRDQLKDQLTCNVESYGGGAHGAPELDSHEGLDNAPEQDFHEGWIHAPEQDSHENVPEQDSCEGGAQSLEQGSHEGGAEDPPEKGSPVMEAQGASDMDVDSNKGYKEKSAVENTMSCGTGERNLQDEDNWGHLTHEKDTPEVDSLVQDIPEQDSQDRDSWDQGQDNPDQDQDILVQDNNIHGQDQIISDHNIPVKDQYISDPIKDLQDEGNLDQGSPDQGSPGLKQDTLDQNVPEKISLDQNNRSTIDQDTSEPSNAVHEESWNSQTQDRHNQDSNFRDTSNHSIQNQYTPVQDVYSQKQETEEHNTHTLGRHDVGILQDSHVLDNQDQNIQKSSNQNQDIHYQNNQDQEVEELDNQDQYLQNLDNQDQDIQNLDNQEPDVRSIGDDRSISSALATASAENQSKQSPQQEFKSISDFKTSGVVGNVEERSSNTCSPSQEDVDEAALEYIPGSREELTKCEDNDDLLRGDGDPDIGLSSDDHILEDPDQDQNSDGAPSVKKMRLSLEDEKTGDFASVESRTIEAPVGGQLGRECDDEVIACNVDSKVENDTADKDDSESYRKKETNIDASEDNSMDAACGTGNDPSEAVNEQDCVAKDDGCVYQGDEGVACTSDTCLEQDSALNGAEREETKLSGCDKLKEEESTEHMHEEQELNVTSNQEEIQSAVSDGCEDIHAEHRTSEGGEDGDVLEGQLASSGCGQENQESSGCGQEPNRCIQEDQELSSCCQADQDYRGCGQAQQDSNGCDQDKATSNEDGKNNEDDGISDCGLTGCGSDTELKVSESGCDGHTHHASGSGSQQETEEETTKEDINDKKTSYSHKEEITGEKDSFLQQTENKEEITDGSAENKTSSSSVSCSTEDRVTASNVLSQLINEGSSEDNVASAQLLKRPSASEGQVSVGSQPLDVTEDSQHKEELSSDPSQVEVDLMLHAESDDLSVFSSEVAEADHLVAMGGKGGLAIAGVKRKSSSSGLSASAAGEGSTIKKRRTSRDSPAIGDSPGAAGSSRDSPGASSSSSKDSKRPREVTPDPVTLKRRRMSGGPPQSGGHGDSPGVTTPGSEQRKRKWGRKRDSNDSLTTPTISTDVLKDIIPSGLEPLEGLEFSLADTEQEQLTGHVTDHVTGSEPAQLAGDTVAVASSQEAETASSSGDRENRSSSRKDSEEPVFSPESGSPKEGGVESDKEVKAGDIDRLRQEAETRRRIEARLRDKQEMEIKERRRSSEKSRARGQSPPSRQPSKLLHVNHLTRPYSRVQLFELLSEDAPIVQEHFWTDNLKSNCIALYESVNAAVATRTRIHGIKWPSTNPKRLSVNFLSAEDAARLSSGQLTLPPELEIEEKDSSEGVAGDVAKDVQVKEEEGVENGEPVSATKKQDQPSSPVSGAAKLHRRSRDSKSSMKDGEEEEAMEESPSESPVKKEPTRTLDELFRKTTSTPSIYWLPLTEDEITERQKKAEEEEAARAKRREERVKAREEERKKRQQDRKDKHEKAAEEDRERRSKAKLRRRRSRSYSRSRSRSRDRDHKRRRK